MRKEKTNFIYTLIISIGFAALSAWRASMNDKSMSFCMGNFAGISLAGVCLAAAMLFLHKIEAHVTGKVPVGRVWTDSFAEPAICC